MYQVRRSVLAGGKQVCSDPLADVGCRMHSPKFDNKAAEFRRLVHSSILERLWKKKKGVRDHMRRQLMPDAVEFLDFHIQHRQRPQFER